MQYKLEFKIESCSCIQRDQSGDRNKKGKESKNGNQAICTLLPYYTACSQSVWRLTFKYRNGEVSYFWISSLLIQIFRFLYLSFLLSNSLVTCASLSCIYWLLFAGFDWFVGSATRYSRGYAIHWEKWNFGNVLHLTKICRQRMSTKAKPQFLHREN